MTFLAVDFGGTRTRAALYSDELVMLHREETPSRVDESEQRVIERIIKLAQAVAGDTTLRAVGMTAPGPLDVRAGTILHAATLPGWNNVPLAALLSEALHGVPVFMENDANLAAIAEYHLGALQGADPAVYMTLSTGIGGGAVIGGHLFNGWSTFAIEPGHFKYPHPDGSIYSLEDLASGTGIGRLARQRLAMTDQPSSLRALFEVTGKAVGAAAQAGDPLARDVVHEAGEWLGFGLISVLHLLSPQRIVLGGSVTLLGDLILTPARTTVQRYILDERFLAPDWLQLAALGDDVCLTGGALYAREQLGTN